jgi:hypothetical protein
VEKLGFESVHTIALPMAGHPALQVSDRIVREVTFHLGSTTSGSAWRAGGSDG